MGNRIRLAGFGMAAVVLGACYGDTAPDQRRWVNKILFIGDSITLHGPSPEKLGWRGDWGMAASKRERDYVHLLYKRLCEAQPDRKPELLIGAQVAAASGTIPKCLEQVEKLAAVDADLIVAQLGENDGEATPEAFEKPYELLIEGLKKSKSRPRIFCAGVWAPTQGDKVKDGMIRAICERQGCVFVDISAVFANPENTAKGLFEHSGVAWHPGDKGMQGYADALWAAIEPFLPIDEKEARKE